jgi:hypothetical protein
VGILQGGTRESVLGNHCTPQQKTCRVGKVEARKIRRARVAPLIPSSTNRRSGGTGVPTLKEGRLVGHGVSFSAFCNLSLKEWPSLMRKTMTAIVQVEYRPSLLSIREDIIQSLGRPVVSVLGSWAARDLDLSDR